MFNLNSTFTDYDSDPQFKEAAEYVIKTQKASATLIQRHFKLGYARSARLLDLLEQAGIVGPVNGANPRLILVDKIENLDTTKSPIINVVKPNTPVLKWNKTIKPTKELILSLGKNEKGTEVNIDLEKYNNVIAVGSQMTNVSDLINGVILEQVQSKSPDDLKLIIIDGFINQIDLPSGSPHLLTPIIRDAAKIESALMWLQSEITKRLLSGKDQKDQSKILLVINGFNEIVYYSSKEVEDRLAIIFGYAKRAGVYIVITADYIDGRISKWIQANNGAKIVFRPTTRQMARSSGVPESIKLESPDQAILETMYEGKTKFNINKVEARKIYEEIYK